jgi:uncharacterized Zn finger protein
MSDSEHTKSPTCPHCGGTMDLKKVVRESAVEYFFKCIACAIEYTNSSALHARSNTRTNE